MVSTLCRAARPGALLLAALALAACDAADPAPSHALVGSWTVTGFESREYITTSTDQRLVDRALPGSGALTVVGDETAELRYLVEGYLSDAFTYFNVSSLPGVGEGVPAYPLAILNLNLTDGAWSIGLTVQEDAFSSRFYLGEPTPTPSPFTYAAGQLTVAEATLAADDGSGGEVVVGGTVTFVTRSVPAGTEMLLREDLLPFPDGLAYAFEDGGVLRITGVVEGQPVSETGTWEVVGDGAVRLVVDGLADLTLDYVVDGAGLRLSESTGSCVDACVRALESAHLLDAGSVSAVRGEEVLVFARGASADASAAPAGARLPASRPVSLPLPGLR